ncbi:MAG: acyl-CoA dehydrogenase family protein [Deltaproteobacteria bacterium]|nr:acyl-CoA dehydrogenase family protein [Deltaproteobacteria bacterium]
MEFILSLLSQEQRMLRESVIKICQGKLKELEEKIGETNIVSREILKFLADQGLLGLTVPGRYGGGPENMSLVSFCLVREELARTCLNAELIFTMQGLGAGPIVVAGSETQKEAYLPPVASGESVITFALTEPSGGSDVAAILTRAERKGDEYILNGSKTFISMAPDADVYTVFAKTDPDKGTKGVTAFIVEKGFEGFTPGARLDLVAAHPIGSLYFEDCRVPAANRLGEEGAGFKIAMQTLDFFRTTVGVCAVGFAQAAFDEALAYARQREAFGQPLSQFQLIQGKLADMATKISAARLLIYRAAFLKDRGKERITKESAMAKLYATEIAQEVIDEAVQIHGGYGVSRGYVVERLYREIRMLRIYEGASEIQRIIIANQLLRR